jgi:hypothetical protein
MTPYMTPGGAHLNVVLKGAEFGDKGNTEKRV